MTTIYKNCEIIYRRKKIPNEYQIAVATPQKDLQVRADSNDNYQIVAQDVLREREELLNKLKLAKEEGEKLFTDVSNWLNNKDRLTPFNKKCLTVLFDKCFVGSSVQEVFERYAKGLDEVIENPADRLTYWRAEGRKLILEYTSENNISISENLSDFIHNKCRISNRANRAKSIENSHEEIVNNISDKINALIARVLKGTQVENLFTTSDVQEVSNEIVNKVRYTPLRRLTYSSLVNFAYVVSKNEVGNEMESRARGEILSEKYKKEIDTELKHNQNFRSAKEEFLDILAKNALEPKLVSKLGILYFTIFEKLTDEELQTRFPGTSRAVRDQWRRRARVFLADKISPNLKQFLDYCTHRKSSNTSPSIH